MLSRTPSPTKPRQPLSSKDANTLSTPAKRLSTQEVSASGKRSRSPSKSPSKKSSPIRPAGVMLTRQVPQLTFKIFEDPTDYTGIQQIAITSINDENDLLHDKENHMITSPDVKRVKRHALGDLDITAHAGYIHYHGKSTSLGKPRTGTYLLDTVWTGDDRISIPSYVTPPRHDRVRYFSNTKSDISIKRSHSANDLKDRAVKRLVFDIHADKS